MKDIRDMTDAECTSEYKKNLKELRDPTLAQSRKAILSIRNINLKRVLGITTISESILNDTSFSMLYENNQEVYADDTMEIRSYCQNVIHEASVIDTRPFVLNYKFNEIEHYIEQYNRIIICRHIAPDADAIGSSTALSTAIHTKYPHKDVILCNESRSITLDPTNDLLFVLDLGVQDRIAGKIEGKCTTIRIDHHPKGMQVDLTIEDSDAGSTSEIITLFLTANKYSIDKKMAEMLFTGIIADTGRMEYSLAPSTLAAINILVSDGVDYKKIYANMYTKSPISLKAKAYIMNNIKISDGGVAYLYINKKSAYDAGTDMDAIGALVYEMSEIKGSLIWVAILDRGNKFNIKIRSRFVQINDIAEKFGGGGHDNASGVSLKNKEAVYKLLDALEMRLLEFKKKNPLLESTKFEFGTEETLQEIFSDQSYSDRLYIASIKEHKENLYKGYRWFQANLPEVIDNLSPGFAARLRAHDNSKSSDAEFEPYVDKFIRGKKNADGYEDALDHHFKYNKHHPQWWNGKDMDYDSVFEMILDWWSFSWRDNDLSGIFAYYENKAKNDPNKNISDNTKEIIEDILDKMKKKL